MKNVKKETMDHIVLGLMLAILLYSVVILFVAYISGTDIGNWIWERHQNLFSWYSRPLFIIPAAYYAYRQKLWHVIGFMLLLATSLFWFEAPVETPEAVAKYLAWEKQLFFTNENTLPLVILIITVFIFLFWFFYAFWKHNAWLGLVLINVGTIIKIIVSIVFGGEAGMAAIAPSLSSLFVINIVAWILWRKKSATK